MRVAVGRAVVVVSSFMVSLEGFATRAACRAMCFGRRSSVGY
jgi:hypothetical protein